MNGCHTLSTTQSRKQTNKTHCVKIKELIGLNAHSAPLNANLMSLCKNERSKSCRSGIRELNQRPSPATCSFVALDKSSFTSLSLSVSTWIEDLDLSFPHSLSLIHHQVLSAVPPKHIRNRPISAHLHELPSSPSHHIFQLGSCCASSWPPCLHSCSPHSPFITRRPKTLQ